MANEGDIAQRTLPVLLAPSATHATRAEAYRPDIDGLRALSVIAVILYHAKMPGFEGGYIGVDVFFVVSGYLITQQLIQPASVDGIGRHLATFYMRRARRILPALFVMLATVTVAAWIWLLPSDLVFLGKYVAMNALMLGNLAGYADFNYFEATSLRPLLHLWSIGVEEQFYLLYPLCVLLVLHKWPSRLRSIVSVLTAVSFLLCVYSSYRMPVANFYFMPTRGWELGAGALLALGAWSALRSQIVNEIATGIALTTLVVCVALYDPETRYPGLYTLPVCAATLLLIGCGAQTRSRVNRLLAVGPLVWIGLASYSLYLWHAPVLVFFEYCLLHEPHSGELVLAAALIIILAMASWALIEQPIRTRRVLRSNRAFAHVAWISAAILLGAGIVLWNSEGYPGRLSPEIQRYTSRENGYAPAAISCLIRGELCRFGTTDPTRPKVLVWGDSHALALFRAYEEHAKHENFAFYIAIRSSCRPLLDPGPLRTKEACASFNASTAHLIERLDPDVIVLNSFWIYDGSRPVLASDPAASGRGKAFETALERTVNQIRRPGRRICVLHDGPLHNGRTPQVLAMAQMRGIDLYKLRLTRTEADTQQSDMDAAIDNLAARGLITTGDLRAQLCNSKFCPLEHDGWPLYVDGHHLSREGSLVASPALDSCFNNIPSQGMLPRMPN